jgi:hypothetical protein
MYFKSINTFYEDTNSVSELFFGTSILIITF